MKNLKNALIPTALLTLPLAALADNGHRHGPHTSHNRHHHKHEAKHYAKRHDHHTHRHHHYDRHDGVYAPANVRGPMAYHPLAVYHPPVVNYSSGVTIHGNVHIPF